MRFGHAAALAAALAWGCDDGGAGGEDPDDAAIELDVASAEADEGTTPDAEVTPDQGAEPDPDEGVVEPDMAPVDPVETVGECGEQAEGTAVNGWLYHDDDASDRSRYAFEISDADRVFEGDVLRLLGPGGEVEPALCADGSYAFDGLGDGVYLVIAEPPAGELCSQRNCPGRFARALAAGQAKMVTFGDSIAVVGTAGTTLFPDRVVELFAPLGDIDNRNVAIGGSTSEDWLPGGQPFERNLRPELADADLIVVTLGGNDVMQYIASFGGIPADIPAAIEGAREVVRQVIVNVEVILAEIRTVNADADILYILYADYTQATGNAIWGLVGGLLGRETLQGVLELARDSMPEEPHLVLADMFGAAQGLPLHDYLEDPLHFNNRGHTLYAEEVFVALGGVLVGQSPLFEGKSPLGLQRSYGFRPVQEAE
ncbi:MAG: SGNH/GDSL hydrolase family protein [Myxococcales bacterium]|nr:SGNH/GDSL hydrolase family protein [Myxococcales bacterium]